MLKQFRRLSTVHYVGIFLLCGVLWLSNTGRPIERVSCTERWFEVSQEDAAANDKAPDRVQECAVKEHEAAEQETGYKVAKGNFYWYATDRRRSSACPKSGEVTLRRLLEPSCYLPVRLQVDDIKVVRDFWFVAPDVDSSSALGPGFDWNWVRPFFSEDGEERLTAPLKVPVAPAASLPSERFSHYRWSVVCDNENTCNVVGAGYGKHDGYGEHDPSLLISRRAGAWEPIRARARFPAGRKWETGLVRLFLNGTDHGALIGPTGAYDYELSASQIQSLLPALIRGYAVVSFKNADGTVWRIPNIGATAVLLKADEVQGRIGTRGAVASKGRRGEWRVPPAPQIPVFRRAKVLPSEKADLSIALSPTLREELRVLPDIEHCRSFLLDRTIRVDRLSTDRVLVSTDCLREYRAERRVFWLANDSAPFKPELLTVNGLHHYRGELLIQKEASYRSGDCATNETWLWDGYRFVQTRMTLTGLCQHARDFDLGGWELPILVKRIIP